MKKTPDPEHVRLALRRFFQSFTQEAALQGAAATADKFQVLVRDDPDLALEWRFGDDVELELCFQEGSAGLARHNELDLLLSADGLIVEAKAPPQAADGKTSIVGHMTVVLPFLLEPRGKGNLWLPPRRRRGLVVWNLRRALAGLVFKDSHLKHLLTPKRGSMPSEAELASHISTAILQAASRAYTALLPMAFISVESQPLHLWPGWMQKAPNYSLVVQDEVSRLMRRDVGSGVDSRRSSWEKVSLDEPIGQDAEGHSLTLADKLDQEEPGYRTFELKDCIEQGIIRANLSSGEQLALVVTWDAVSSGLTAKEVCQERGLSYPSYRTLWHTAKAKLAKHLDECWN